MSGHSKWAQIKHKKATTDAKRGQLFSKMVKEITVAARSGGLTPETNSRLKTAIERARAIGLPKENMERAISRASGGEDAPSLQEFLYEAMAPHGVYIIIEGITDNKNRTLAEIKHILSECGGRLAEQGSLIWNFEKIGLIKIFLEENSVKTGEEIELAIIESGAKDFQKKDDFFEVETEFQEIEKIRKELEKREIKIKEVGYDYRSKSFLGLSDQEKITTEIITEKLFEHDDVQEIYTNIKP